MKSLFYFVPSLSLVAASFLVNAVSVAAAEECDRCNFDGNDPSDCKDYGLIDNSILIGWNLGSDECLEEFNIKITTPDPSLICGSVNSFVNELRFGSSLDTAKLGLGVASDTEGGFYNDGPVLKDEIIIDGTAIDCKESESNCYNAMNPYFETDVGGKQEMDDVCDQLYNKVKTDKQLEQSTMRNRLCLEYRDGTTIPSTCEPLLSQLLEQMDKYPDKGCQGFAFGTQNTPIPGCDDEEDATTPTLKSNNDNSSANNTTPKIIGSLLLLLLLVNLTTGLITVY